MTMNASDNDDGNIRCSRSRFALIITLLVCDRGQVEEKRSDKPDSELKKKRKAWTTLPKPSIPCQSKPLLKKTASENTSKSPQPSQLPSPALEQGPFLDPLAILYATVLAPHRQRESQYVSVFYRRWDPYVMPVPKAVAHCTSDGLPLVPRLRGFSQEPGDLKL